MKPYYFLLLPFLLAGCPLEEKSEPTMCYEIVNATSQPSPILLNKCTGMTYIMLNNAHPDGTATWVWYQAAKIDSVNFVKGK